MFPFHFRKICLWEGFRFDDERPNKLLVKIFLFKRFYVSHKSSRGFSVERSSS